MIGLILKFIPGGLSVAMGLAVLIGFGLGVGWEHRPHLPIPFIGQGLKVQRDVLQHQITDVPKGWASRLSNMTAERDAWKAAIKARDAAATDQGKHEASAAGAAAGQCAVEISSAYKRGVKAGRVLTCTVGAANAPSTHP